MYRLDLPDLTDDEVLAVRREIAAEVLADLAREWALVLSSQFSVVSEERSENRQLTTDNFFRLLRRLLAEED